MNEIQPYASLDYLRHIVGELDLIEEWTAESVKKELPQVPVKLESGKIVHCTVSGRLLPFAKVSIPLPRYYGVGQFKDIEVSWITIANVLNEKEFVRI